MTNSHDTTHETPLAERVLARIHEGEVTPRPRWAFLFENYFFWGSGVLAVVLGAVACSALIFEIANVDWRFADVTHTNLISFFLDAAPFLWIGVVVLFLFLGYRTVRKTNHGYRYPLTVIAVGAVLLSLTLGSGLYVLGLGSTVENMAGDHIPFHRSILTRQHTWWLAPSRGLLGGEVVAVASDTSSFLLRDWNGTSWQVDAGDLHTPDRANVVRGGDVRVVGLPVSVTTATSSTFHACFVLPWEVRGGDRRLSPAFPFPVNAAARVRLSTTSPSSEKCQGITPYGKLRALEKAGF